MESGKSVSNSVSDILPVLEELCKRENNTKSAFLYVFVNKLHSTATTAKSCYMTRNVNKIDDIFLFHYYSILLLKKY